MLSIVQIFLLLYVIYIGIQDGIHKNKSRTYYESIE